MLRRLSLLLVMSGAILPLAAPSVYADAPMTGRVGRAEVRFMEGMVDHHQMAVDMADDCLMKATTDSVRTLCQNVIAAQTPEIGMLRGWLLEWYNVEYQTVPMPTATMSEMGGMEGMNHDGMAMGDQPYTDPAMMMGMMAGFNRLEGAAYDAAWLESMIDHHDDALHMSERILERAQHSELVTLAENIIKAQTAEIEMMETMIAAMGEE